MSRLFAMGDLHLSLNSDKPMDVFGYAWKDHHVKIKENWLKMISDADVVFLPGDHSWAMKTDDAFEDLDWIDSLPGFKILLKGNHDLWWSSVGKLRDRYKNMRFIQNDCVLINDTAFCGSRGWLTPQDQNFSEATDRHIYERELIRLGLSLESAVTAGAKRIICGIHFPPACGNSSYSGFTELFERYAVKKVIYGHLHGREAFKRAITGVRDGTEYILASADFLGFKPLFIEEM